ncbi:hypothetical protein [Aquibacillus kalidii]|nr:hypothetical protein [Aquibacillus kalidii]
MSDKKRDQKRQREHAFSEELSDGRERDYIIADRSIEEKLNKSRKDR